MNLYIKDLEHDEPISNMIRAMLTESIELNQLKPLQLKTRSKLELVICYLHKQLPLIL